MTTWTSEDYFSSGKPIKLRLTIITDGQSISGNYTDVRWSIRAIKTGYSPTWSNHSSHYSVAIGRPGATQNWQGNISSYDFRNTDDITLKFGTKRIYHKSDGTSDIYGGANADLANLGYADVPKINKTLPRIPRKSTPSFDKSSFEAGEEITIYTDRADPSFTHTVKYSFAGASGTIYTKTTDSRPKWTPPLSILSNIPNRTSAKCTITLTTYDGNTSLGSASNSFTLEAPASVVPSFTDVSVQETNQTVIDKVGQYVQDASTVDVAINGAAGAYGSSIESYKLEVGGAVINAQSGSSIRIPDSGSVTVRGTITDSRNRKAVKTQTIQVLPYAPPKLNSVSFQRSLADGTPDGSGSYIRANINTSVSSIAPDGSEKNSLTYSIYTRQHGSASAWEEKKVVTAPGLAFSSYDVISSYDVEQSWDAVVQVTDLFATSVQQGLIAVGQVFMHWGGKNEGLGVGKFWERGGLDVRGQIYQNGGDAVVDDAQLAVAIDTALADFAAQQVVQAGRVTTTSPPNTSRQLVTFSFPKPFAEPPILMVTPDLTTGGTPSIATASLVNTTATTGAIFYSSDVNFSSGNNATYTWMAIGKG